MDDDNLKQLLDQLRNLPENYFCADCICRTSAFASINNGVFLCIECADSHTTLGNQISYVRDLDLEFDEYLVLFLVRGGNKRFLKFLETEYLKETFENRKLLYRSKALDYYRRTIKSEISGEEPPERLEKFEMLEIYPYNSYPQNFPEFENYYFEKENPEKNQGILEKLGNVKDTIRYNLSHLQENAKINLQRSGIIEKIKSGGKLTYDSLKNVGFNIFSYLGSTANAVNKQILKKDIRKIIFNRKF